MPRHEETTTASPVRSLRSGKVVLLILVAVAVLAHVAVYFNFSEDDPGISFRYAANLAEGRGLVYNPGQWVEGYSNFGHVLLLAALYSWIVLGSRLSLMVAVKLVNVVLSVTCALLLFRLLDRNPAFGRRHAIVAVALLVSAGGFAISTASPLETAGIALLTLVAGAAVVRYLDVAAPRAGAVAATAVPLVLLSLWRIDAPLLSGSMLLVLVLSRRLRLRRSDAWLLAAVAIPLLAYTIFRWKVFGGLLPNTFAAKVELDPSAADGWSYLWRFLLAHGTPLLVLPALAGGLWARTRLERLAALVVVTQMVYVLVVQGDWIPGFRFLVPVLPLLAILEARLLVGLGERWCGSAAVPVVAAATVVLAASQVVLGARHYVDPGSRSPLSWVRRPTLAPAQLTPYSGISRWLDDVLTDDAVLVLGEGGFIPFLTDRWTYDTFGLCTPSVARLEEVARDRWGVRVDLLESRSPVMEMLLARDPDVLLVVPHLPPDLPRTAGDGRYDLVKVIPVNQFAAGLDWSRRSPYRCAVYVRRGTDAFEEYRFFRGALIHATSVRASGDVTVDPEVLAGGAWVAPGGGPAWVEGVLEPPRVVGSFYLGEAGSRTAPSTAHIRVLARTPDGWRELFACAGRNVGLTLDGTFDDSLTRVHRQLAQPIEVSAVRIEIEGEGELTLANFGLQEATAGGGEAEPRRPSPPSG